MYSTQKSTLLRASVFLALNLCLALPFIYSAASASSEPDNDKQRLSDYWQEAGKHFNLACEKGSEFKQINQKTLDLKTGTFLIESQGGLELQLPWSVMSMPGKSMVLIRISKDGSERIYCLVDSVNVACEKRSISMRCGDELLLTDHNPQRELGGEYAVMVRQLRISSLADKIQAATMEFSIVQAMMREPLLNQISHSTHPHDRVLRTRLLKAAAIFQMFPSRGQYFLPAGN